MSKKKNKLSNAQAESSFKTKSQLLYESVENRNQLNPENLFAWRMCFNTYLWLKYLGPIIGFLILYVLLGYVLGRTFGIALPLLALLFEVVLLGILFTAIGGWVAFLGLCYFVFIQWRKNPKKYFNKYQRNFQGKYQKYSVVKGPFNIGSRNFMNKPTPWIVLVEYLDEDGQQKVAQSYLGNIIVLHQMRPGDKLTICRVQGHFKKYLDVALVHGFQYANEGHDNGKENKGQEIQTR